MGKKNAAIVIRPKTAKDRARIQGVLQELGLDSHPLSEDELLDLGLAQMMRTVDRSKKVDPKTAMKILAS